MSDAPRLAVVVPAHRAAGTIEACLRDLLASTSPPDEIVVVDDASPDDTAARAAALGARVVRRERNGGPSAARNTGWRATTAPLVAFVDADVEVAPDALARLVAALHDPALAGANGVLSVDVPPRARDPERSADTTTGGVTGGGAPRPTLHLDVTRFVNVSLRFQHQRHGGRVASAFTSLCVFRRETLVRMGGWDERAVSRYADDVATRWVLPPGSIACDPEATGRHHKRVPLAGLLKHRRNVGVHFVESVRANAGAARSRPSSVVLDRRYPLNTALAAASVPALVASAVVPAVGWLALAGLGTAFVVNNAGFVRYVRRLDGDRAAAHALAVTLAESYAYAGGVVLGVARAASAEGTPKPGGSRVRP
jgi:glycosyltransferase involved in cell wall biosynthesis